MLFRIQAFKNISKDGLVLNCPENLYNLGVLDGLGEQPLKLKDEILDHFVFCQGMRESDGLRIALEERLTEGALRYRMKRGGEITGFEQVTKPYGLRYGAAKAFNDSCELSGLFTSKTIMSLLTLPSPSSNSGCDERAPERDVTACEHRHLR
jgi:hypothetical protein